MSLHSVSIVISGGKVFAVPHRVHWSKQSYEGEDLVEDLSPQYMNKLILSYRQARQLSEPQPYRTCAYGTKLGRGGGV
jgi:hypothetical protein